MEPVVISIFQSPEYVRFSKRKKNVNIHDISIDKSLSVCFIREILSRNDRSEVHKIPLETISEVRRWKSSDSSEENLIILYGTEFNLKLFEFKTLNSENLNILEKNLNRNIEYARTMTYSDKLTLWIDREYKYHLNGSKKLEFKQIIIKFLNRSFITKSTTELEEHLKSKRVFTTQDAFRQLAREFLHDRKVFDELFGIKLQEFNYSQISDRYVRPFKSKRLSSELELIQRSDSIGISVGKKLLRRKSSSMSDVVQLTPTPVDTTVCSDVTKNDRNSLVNFRFEFMSLENSVNRYFSKENAAYDPHCLRHVYQDMKQSLSSYWISSSHNTYLRGNQYSSDSSVEPYARCLLEGCRCIEIDVWDGPKNFPIVTHGRTLTSSVPLKDVLQIINKYAFKKSEYPLIISIENHCSKKQQKAMAKLFILTFKPEVIIRKVDEKMSPSDLKNRIILKCRKLVPSQSDIHGEGSQETKESFLCDTLRTGKLFLYNSQNPTFPWEPYFFALTNKSFMYIEITEENKREFRDLQAASLTSASDIYFNELWFYGKLKNGKEEAAEIVKTHGVEGCFLIRNRDSFPSEYSLCVLLDNKVRHLQIYSKIATSSESNSETHFHLTENPKEIEMFESLHDLVSYYQETEITVKNGSKGKLSEPAMIKDTHEDETWFHKECERSISEVVLSRINLNGAFIARYSKQRIGGRFVISFRTENEIKHCQIKEEGRFLTVSSKKFASLSELVEFYKSNCFYKEEKLIPVTKAMYDLALNGKTEQLEKLYATDGYLPSTVKTEKTSVKAIHSYSSDASEVLSFEKGAIIENVVKIDETWWKGSLKGSKEPHKQKLFPAHFVEEIEVLESPFGNLQKGSIEIAPAKYKKNRNKEELKEVPYILELQGKKGKDVKETVQVNKLGVGSLREAKKWKKYINYVEKKRQISKTLKAHKIQKEFSDLIGINCISGRRFDPTVKTNSKLNETVLSMTSFPEAVGKIISTADMQSFVEFTWRNQSSLSRIYPKAPRLDSSNLNPLNFWNCGCQMVALNFQTPDKPMQWNRGKFRQNGGCGYLLKPEFMRTATDADDLQAKLSAEVPMKLIVKVIAARHLTKEKGSTLSPFIGIEIMGMDSDCKKFKTVTIPDNGLNPYWNEEFVINIDHPQLALIQFTAVDEDTFGDGQLLGESTIPVNCLRMGQRSLQLYNKYGEELLLSTLLVFFEKRLTID